MKSCPIIVKLGIFAVSLNNKYPININTKRYMIPHIENVKPEGVNKVGYLLEISPVEIPPKGFAFAK